MYTLMMHDMFIIMPYLVKVAKKMKRHASD